MECQHASELIMCAADGELVDAALLIEAKMHCATCPQCHALERLLDREGSLQPPTAPASLVARIDLAAAEIAREQRETAAAASLELLQEGQPTRGRRRWFGVIAFASTAAVLFVGLSIATLVIGLGSGQQRASETMMELGEDNVAESAPSDMGAGDTFVAPATSVAPAYVVFDGIVYAQSSAAVPSVLATAGTVVSDLGTGSSEEHTAMSEPGTSDPIFVEALDGTYISFRRVVRTRARNEYALSSESPITHFGQWPSLPGAYAVPQNVDGSPTFTERGFDDHRQTIYMPATRSLEDAFAIAPGTPEGDPAAGNPNWTWWVRVE